MNETFMLPDCVTTMWANNPNGSYQARIEGVAPVTSRYSYELAQKSLFRSDINPSSRVDYIKFITKHTSLCSSSSSFSIKAQMTFLIYLNNDF